MTFLLFEYSFILIFCIVAAILSFVIFIASFLLATQNNYAEKVSPYECGFDPFEDARNQFDVRFYLVAILFLIFDLEASFLFPWSIIVGKLGSFSFWIIIDFFVELVIGFLYAWKVGALEW
uniref:NADH-ubiquinone oxidoreductase chain 3 n=2 Tax=Thraustochytriidae TaxID=33674 RepID=A0A481XHQ6_9STRA|nr:NADH dehydrogenase subunit 3 [Schizochytrium sp. TIO1101]QBK37904.1 NADH dehydrogenase subunit 3 [Aurantiochytrium acetophilum]